MTNKHHSSLASVDAATRELIRAALAEDLEHGDVTTEATVRPEQRGRATLLAKSDLVLSGTVLIGAVFDALQEGAIQTRVLHHAGEKVSSGTVVAELEGSLALLLNGERVMLNLLMHLSGVATLTHAAVTALLGSKTRVLDTRKTLPGLRRLQKQAVRDGGGVNHRFSLSDGILIKDNHITAAGSVSEAIRRARAAAHHLLKIECEVSRFEQIDEALHAGADVLLLDNMSDVELTRAVAHIAGRAVTEASGNMTIERMPSVGRTGVDFVSLGALTHSVPAADLSMKIS